MVRRYLSASDLRNMLRRQMGLCANPSCMSEGPFEADHSTPHTWDDKKPDQLLCVPCHRAKTKRDIKAIAKVNRITGKTSSQWNGDRKSRPIQGTMSALARLYINPHDVRNVIFNAEMALCDIRAYASGSVEPEHALERARELRVEAAKLEALFTGETNAPA